MLKQIMKGRFEDNEATTTEASNYKKTVKVDNTVAAPIIGLYCSR